MFTFTKIQILTRIRIKFAVLSCCYCTGNDRENGREKEGLGQGTATRGTWGVSRIDGVLYDRVNFCSRKFLLPPPQELFFNVFSKIWTTLTHVKVVLRLRELLWVVWLEVGNPPVAVTGGYHTTDATFRFLGSGSLPLLPLRDHGSCFYYYANEC